MDVERAISAWLSGEGSVYVEKVLAQAKGIVEVAERAELARLQAKYGKG